MTSFGFNKKKKKQRLIHGVIRPQRHFLCRESDVSAALNYLDERQWVIDGGGVGQSRRLLSDALTKMLESCPDTSDTHARRHVCILFFPLSPSF